MNSYDTVIIGAGHNGLVCAAYLAKSGQRVLVLEAGSSVGGMASSREFHPGFAASVAETVSHFSRQVVTDLELEKYGLDTRTGPIAMTGLDASGAHVTVRGDQLTGVADEDVAAYRRYLTLMRKFADALEPSWRKTMPRLGNNSLSEIITFGLLGLKLRMLGRKDMREFMRIASLPTRDLADEFFSSDILKSMISWDGLLGSRMAPRSPNGAVLSMLYRMAGDVALPPGGASDLVKSLQASAEAHGVEIRTDTEVAKILVGQSSDGLKANGLKLTDGESLEVGRVVSAVDPRRTFLGLLGVENLEIEFTNRIRRIRCDGFVAKLHVALDSLPEFTGLDSPEGRLIIAPELDAIEFSFDNAKYGELPENPVMELSIPSLHSSDCAPDGQHVMSVNVMYVPRKLKGGWDDSSRDALREKVVDLIARYSPGFRDKIVATELLTPTDIEHFCRVTGGHWHHTEMAMDQMLMMRPTYEAAQYSTPVPGLWLCGAGSHPGGDLTGLPGHNAAREILK